VKNAAAHGDLNDTQLAEYKIECQRHSTRMGKKPYNFSREPDRAKTLQQINDMINKKYQVKKNDNCNSATIDVIHENNAGIDGNNFEESEYDISIDAQHCVKKRKRDENYGHIEEKKNLSYGDEILIDNHDDWGKKHAFYEIESVKIKWSLFEKDYLQALYDKNRHKHNVWRHCLDSILNANDENVRQQFHKSHLAVGKLKDAIRVKK